MRDDRRETIDIHEKQDEIILLTGHFVYQNKYFNVDTNLLLSEISFLADQKH